MSGLVDLLEIVKKALEEAERDFGKINVLIAGRTGVGKSTLINSVFRGSLATTGQGEPVTQTTRLLSKRGVPLAIWDTRGLEMADFAETLGELTRLVEIRLQDPNPKNHVHVAWLCLHEDGRRVEVAERDQDLHRVTRCGGRSGRRGGAGRRCGQEGVYETGGAKVGKTRLAV